MSTWQEVPQPARAKGVRTGFDYDALYAAIVDAAARGKAVLVPAETGPDAHRIGAALYQRHADGRKLRRSYDRDTRHVAFYLEAR